MTNDRLSWRIRQAVAGSAFLLLACFLGFLVWTPPAEALSDPLGTFRVYTFSCTTAGQQIVPSSGRKSSKAARFWNNSATPVYLGGSDVATTSTGYPICTDTAVCEASGFSIDSAPVVWCRAGSTVSIVVSVGL